MDSPPLRYILVLQMDAVVESLSLEQARSVSFSLEQIYRDRVPSGGNRTRHYDAGFTCWLIDEGTVRVDRDQNSFTARTGDWVLLDPFHRRDQTFSRNARLLSIRFRVQQDRSRLFSIESPIAPYPRIRPPTRTDGEALPARDDRSNSGTMPD